MGTDEQHRTYNTLHRVLTRAMKDRPHRADWIQHEREQVTNTVNNIRAKHGLPKITADHIRTIEDGATGADYAHKLALRCTELALGRREPR